MIIAEIGQNFCGQIGWAEMLIDLAKSCGGDLAKFQLYDSKKLYGEEGHNELTFEQAKHLFKYGKKAGIEVFFSVFDVERVKWCEKIGVKRYKLASSVNQETINAVLRTQKPFIISSNSGQISVLGNNLFCVPEYPAPVQPYLDVDFITYDGISDHTIGLDVARIAIARGARIVEKHFAIDHKTGVDAEWSMTPSELKELKRWEKLIT